MAVVVWEDITVPAGRHLYSNVGDLIQVYAQDVADTGFQVAVFKFYGMAEDPVGDPDPENPVPDLRRKLSELRGQGGLSGVQLIGNCPYILRELPGGGGDCECEFFLADLDATLYDTPNADLRQGVFDDWSGDGADILGGAAGHRAPVAGRLHQCAHPGLSWTEELVLRDILLRNHALRWQVFDTHHRARTVRYLRRLHRAVTVDAGYLRIGSGRRRGRRGPANNPSTRTAAGSAVGTGRRVPA